MGDATRTAQGVVMRKGLIPRDGAAPPRDEELPQNVTRPPAHLLMVRRSAKLIVSNHEAVEFSAEFSKSASRAL
jgi:hypothetical protein